MNHFARLSAAAVAIGALSMFLTAPAHGQSNLDPDAETAAASAYLEMVCPSITATGNYENAAVKVKRAS